MTNKIKFNEERIFGIEIEFLGGDEVRRRVNELINAKGVDCMKCPRCGYTEFRPAHNDFLQCGRCTLLVPDPREQDKSVDLISPRAREPFQLPTLEDSAKCARGT